MENTFRPPPCHCRNVLYSEFSDVFVQSSFKSSSQQGFTTFFQESFNKVIEFTVRMFLMVKFSFSSFHPIALNVIFHSITLSSCLPPLCLQPLYSYRWRACLPSLNYCLVNLHIVFVLSSSVNYPNSRSIFVPLLKFVSDFLVMRHPELHAVF